MDEEMFTLHNVMPVELALKRELEYRRRMEIGDLMKPLVLIQGQTPSQTGTKRKEPYSAAQCSPTLLSSSSCQRSTGFICVVCKIAFATVYHLKQHEKTAQHRTRLSMTRRRGENISNPFLCELCNASCSSAMVMEFHFNGLKHIASVQEFETAKRARSIAFMDANQ